MPLRLRLPRPILAYHRSYTLTVRQGEARIVVDAYGDELHDVTEPVSEGDWTALLDRLATVGAGIGGDDAPALDVSVEVCGGGERQAEVLEDVVAPVLDRFDMSPLLATG